MRISRVIAVLVLGLSLTGLGACSYFKRGGSEAIYADDASTDVHSATYTSGLGEQQQFSGVDKDTQRLLSVRKFYFGFDNSSVSNKYSEALKAQADYLISHPNAHILLSGNTDSRGSREYNLALGERRAKAIANTLKKYGVPSKQIRIISYGQEKPVALGHTEAAYRLNRRTDLSYESIS